MAGRGSLLEAGVAAPPPDARISAFSQEGGEEERWRVAAGAAARSRRPRLASSLPRGFSEPCRDRLTRCTPTSRTRRRGAGAGGVVSSRLLHSCHVHVRDASCLPACLKAGAGPGLSFARELLRRGFAQEVGLVPCACGGSELC